MQYIFPPISLLKREYSRKDGKMEERFHSINESLENALTIFGVNASIIESNITSNAYVFTLKPERGADYKAIQKLKNDFEVAVGGYVELISTEDGCFHFAVKFIDREILPLRNVLSSEGFVNAESPLTIAAGQCISGEYLTIDIEEAPHIFVAGTTGAGKSTFLDAIICSLLYKATPEEVQLILIDVKGVDLIAYNGIPHINGNTVITNAKDAITMLYWVEETIRRRMEKFSKVGARNHQSYKDITGEACQRIVIIIDEYRELTQKYLTDEADSELEEVLDYIGRMGRAAGVHLIIATQSGLSKSVSGKIKANLTYRVLFAATNSAEAKTVIDQTGFQKLLGAGDMIASSGTKTVHAQAAYVSYEEVQDIVTFVKP